MPEPVRLRCTQSGQPAPASAEELLVLAARGDSAAFARFYDVVIGPVWGIVRQLVRDEPGSAEITEAVLLAAWREAACFDPGRGSALAWIVARAHRAAVHHLRGGAPVPRPRPAETPEPEAPQPEPGGTSLRRHQLRRHLAELTQEQRDCLVLAYYQGRDCAQIAALLNLPVPTVRRRLRDAMIRLRDRLGVN
ncbi:sigma-70 family RNA polymerase sigma factor [Crossiella cryophila]|uniref:RNA polymerase sigma-70 factor (ECF subfamily) n=1 Tax=Crossiella cryophila TaxID=43355 RepID=A0A7W7FTW9_9PSEU|nr:sigma-70 family RNA polymerase sigma factor [Crossiella cryophila]MBB4678621.1 RNA polymerase sigma-70 factor (ECF subfamily) [Crossiella cryophila]